MPTFSLYSVTSMRKIFAMTPVLFQRLKCSWTVLSHNKWEAWSIGIHYDIYENPGKNRLLCDWFVSITPFWLEWSKEGSTCSHNSSGTSRKPACFATSLPFWGKSKTMPESSQQIALRGGTAMQSAGQTRKEEHSQ